MHENNTLYFSGSKKFSANIQVGINSAPGDGGNLHLAAKPSASSKNWPKDYIADIVLSASSASVLPGATVGLSEESKDVESYPSHNMLPIMIYIGKASEDGGGSGGDDDSKYTKIFSNDKTWSINVINLTREIIDHVVGNE